MVNEACCASQPGALQVAVSQYAVHLSRTPADGAFPRSNTPSLAEKAKIGINDRGSESVCCDKGACPLFSLVETTAVTLFFSRQGA